jgi:hypothetical protein
LPRPDHRLFETHPIVNSQLLYQVGHGRVRIRPAIEELRGDRVRFVDGTEEPFDVIVCATGYRVRFPFVAPGVLAGRPDRPTAEQEDEVPELYLHAFHPLRDDFFVAGMIQPNSGLWPLADDQTRLMAAFVAATAVDSPASRWFRRLKAGQNPDLSGGLSFDRSPRHRLEVEYYSYRRRLRKLLARFDREQPPRPVPAPVADTTPAASRFDAWAPQPANRLRGENV